MNGALSAFTRGANGVNEENTSVRAVRPNRITCWPRTWWGGSYGGYEDGSGDSNLLIEFRYSEVSYQEQPYEHEK